MNKDRLAGFPKAVAILGGLSFVAFGIWAMAAPTSFFDTLATFDPYNQHFIQDIGAFQIGLGAVLLFAASGKVSGLAGALFGTGIGAAGHGVSHIVGNDLGGRPMLDIPMALFFAVVLLGAGWMHATGSDKAA